MIPKSVNILGITYRVQEKAIISRDDARKGEIDFIHCAISIDEALPDDMKKQVLLHEIIHAVCDLLLVFMKSGKMKTRYRPLQPDCILYFRKTRLFFLRMIQASFGVLFSYKLYRWHGGQQNVRRKDRRRYAMRKRAVPPHENRAKRIDKPPLYDYNKS